MSSFAILLSGQVLMAEYKAGQGQSPYAPKAGNRAQWRYLALGDSYTIGESVGEDERFPAQLMKRLTESRFPNGKVEIIARTGWTTDELAKAIDENEPDGTFELVTLLIGVNNQYRGRDPSEYRSEFAALLERAIKFAGNRPERVVVVSIPDWGVTPLGKGRENVGREIDAFNAINRDETLAKGAHYVDITPTSRKALNEPLMTAADGLHPSGVLYAQWVELILPAAIKALDSRK